MADRTSFNIFVPGACSQVIEVKDEAGQLMNDFTGRVRWEDKKAPSGTLRTLTVALDTSQYQLDMNAMAGAKQV